MKPFRSKHPTRTYIGPAKTSYKQYRPELEADFNGRCAYTDCLQSWWADGFHIDHFAPRKPKLIDPARLAAFTAREHSYSNLVYSCPQVNRAKGNDWPSEDPDVPIVGDKGYLDPCSDFNELFERTDSGAIVPKENPVARYMWRRLKLYLRRYELYWRIEQITLRQKRLQNLRTSLSLPANMELEILRSIAELADELNRYLDYLGAPVEA